MLVRLIGASSIALLLTFLASCSSKRVNQREYIRVNEASTKILFGSCNDQDLDQRFWKALTLERADLAILMGDNVYNKGKDKASLYTAYRTLKSNPLFREFKKSTPIVAIWDDGDYGKNDGGSDLEYKMESKEMLMNFWGEPKNSERRQRDGIYDAFVVGPPGTALQVILLDVRNFRSPLRITQKRIPGRGPYGKSLDVKTTILGEAQWAWLKKQLEVPADVRLIVSGIQVVGDEHGFESWGNFPHEKARLAKLLDRAKAKQVILLSGDRHHASFWEWKRPRGTVLHEFTSSSFNRPLPEVFQIVNPEKNRDGGLEFRPNFGVLIIDWNRQKVTAELHLTNGDLARKKDVSFRLVND